MDPFSPSEADSIISVQEVGKAKRQGELRAQIESVPALSEAEIIYSGQKTVFRRVAPVVALDSTIAGASIGSEALRLAEPEYSEAELSKFLAEQKEQQMLHLSATVYDHRFSEITLTLDEQRYTVWANLDFNLLRSIGSFSSESVTYNYFGFTNNITQADEARIAEETQARGYRYESRWKAAPAEFSSDALEYIVATENADEVPPALYAQLDALFAYYLENETELKSNYQRAQALRAAQLRYSESHPTPPELETIINFYPTGKSTRRSAAK